MNLNYRELSYRWFLNILTWKNTAGLSEYILNIILEKSNEQILQYNIFF